MTNDLCQSDDEFDANTMLQQNRYNIKTNLDDIRIGNETTEMNTYMQELCGGNSYAEDIKTKTGNEEINDRKLFCGGISSSSDSESNNTNETNKDLLASDNIIGIYKKGTDCVDINLPKKIQNFEFEKFDGNVNKFFQVESSDHIDGPELDLMLASVSLNGENFYNFLFLHIKYHYDI